MNRFVRSVQTGLDNHEKRIAACQDQIAHLLRIAAMSPNQSDATQEMEGLKRDSAHYTQVVMLAGYAGFFALWTQTRDEMSLWMFASTGALISVSLAVFVLHELFKTWQVGNFFARNPPPYQSNDVNTLLSAANKHWKTAFLLSAIPGLIAGLSLLAWFVFKSVVAASQVAGNAA